MPSTRTLLSQFNGGEWSPLLEGRVDQDGYGAALRAAVNMLPTIQGPAMMRPGTLFIGAVKTAADTTALIPFVYSTAQAYTIEAGAGYFRFYADRARIDVAATDGAIGNGDFPAGITGWDDVSTGGAGNAIAHDATNGRLSLTVSGTAADDIGWAEQDVVISAAYQAVEHSLQFDVIGAAGDQIEFQVGTSTGDNDVLGPLILPVGRHVISFTPGATTFYVQFRNRGNFREKTVQIDNVALLSGQALELLTPYAAADTMGIRAVQSVDVLYLDHASYARRELRRYGNTSWSLVEHDFQDGPYLAQNATATTLTPGAAAGFAVTFTASDTVGINGGDGFKTTDVGRLIRYKNGSNAWGWARIVSWTSATAVKADIRSTLTAAAAVTTWRLGLYSDTGGHASNGQFYAQRAVLAGAGAQPDRADFSATDDYVTFAPDTADDDGFPAVLATDGANPIHWTVAARVLLVGTGASVADQRPAVIRPGGAFRIGVANTATALTPSNVEAKPENITVLAVSRAGTSVVEMAYDFGQDGFVPQDKSFRAEHIGALGLDRLAWLQEPWSTCFAVMGDGRLASYAYNRQNQVSAWARQTIGGSFGGGIAQVQDCAVIPASGKDELWMIVKRTVNGAPVQYIEVMTGRLTETTPQEDAFFVDCGLTLDAQIAASGATQAEPVVLTIESGHGLVDGDLVIASDFAGMTELNGETFSVQNATATTVELYLADGATALDGTGYTAYVSGGVLNKKVTAVAGLDHLEGETVAVLGDGAAQAAQVVASGAIALERAAGVVHAGLSYDWVLYPQRLEGGASAGAHAQGSIRKISDVRARVWRTGPFSAGPDADNLKVTPWSPPRLGRARRLTSADIDLPFTGSADFSGDVYLTGSSPLPANIVALMYRATVEEEYANG